ncbi:right-handed parallel beta-helix repeat-containing protein [Neorhodopirellula lusitana]|uniref:right-handed parallel beta-helix repeat-containing protein n=1 Tax=Neorhodopirellula lusitana TaxID=445327 RepID=UPI00385108B6
MKSLCPPVCQLFFPGLIIAIALQLVSSTAIQGGELFVAPSGNDSNPGTQSAPFATLHKAKQVIAANGNSESVHVHVANGTYYLPETLIFTPADSGTQDAPVLYQAESEGGVVLSGGLRLDLTWQPYRDGILMAQTPVGLSIDQLFVNGTNQRMARYPNFDATKKTEAYQGFAADAFSKERAATWADPTGGYIHAMHRARWGGYHYRINGKDDKGEVTYEGGWQNNRPMGMHKDYRMVENIFEELDAPGEWFHNADKNILYHIPTPGTDLAKANIEVVRLGNLVEFRGSEDKPVQHITLKGFTVRHSARTFMDTKEPLLRSDWAIYRGGAFMLTGTHDIQILDCEFDQVGGNAIFANNYNRRVLVKGCHIHDTGASGVCFVGDPDAVRDPLFAYGQKNDLSKIDRKRGPKTNNYPADCTVEDCLIHGIGRVERQPAGVQIEMASRITVRNCSVYDCARSGINIGDGCWGGHRIEGCDVFDTVQETHDHGSFNSWGRDRFWRSDQKTSQAAIDKDPELPFLDAIQTTVIHDNRFRCDHGWDIDLDDGSTNYDIYNNLCLAGGLKLREGFRRRAWNNITVNNGLHPHVWYNNSGDEVWGNIFMLAPRAARMPTQLAKGKRVDGNLYFAATPEIKNRFARFGWDVNSLVADPLFINPAEGDFRVKEGSPAFKIGFKNFPMDQFGVQKPSLKKIAETPTIPEVEPREALSPPRPDSPKPPAASAAYVWLGAEVASLKGQEFSAFGVSKDDGGVKVSNVLPSCDAAKIGLKNDDLIQSLNGKPVKGVADLIQAYTFAGDSPLTLAVIRNQAPIKIESDDAAFVELESAATANSFKQLVVHSKPNGSASANPATKEASLSSLVDGKLEMGYGPIFANGVLKGIYRLDLGEPKSVTAITSWSANQGGIRGKQNVTLFGSNAKRDPGWKLDKKSGLTPLGTIDTSSRAAKKFNAVSLKARNGKSLGTFRWIYWQTRPVSSKDENSAFQELQVE